MADSSLAGPVCGVVLAGGQGKRMGGDKHRALLDGKTLLGHVMERLTPQVDHMAIAGDHASLRHYGVPVLPDGAGLSGPAAGLHSALSYASKYKAALITVPCDTPFLPGGLGEMLGKTSLTVPDIDGRALWVVSYWPESEVSMGLHALEALARGAAPALREVYGALGVRRISVPGQEKDGFMGINTPQALEQAAAHLKRRKALLEGTQGQSR